jgi:hypothetical protein
MTGRWLWLGLALLLLATAIGACGAHPSTPQDALTFESASSRVIADIITPEARTEELIVFGLGEPLVQRDKLNAYRPSPLEEVGESGVQFEATS